MIKSFKSKATWKIFNREFSLKLPNDIQRITLRKLLMIDAAANLSDLRSPPANHLELMKGKYAGFYSIRINDQWRICFYWYSNDAYEVEIIDYH